MWRVLNVMENDSQSPETEYDVIYIYRDGPNECRQITVGRGITEYGNLKKLIQTYINDGGKFAPQFSKFLDKIGKTALVDNMEFRGLIKRAAKEDAIFRAAEDKIFEDKYFKPACAFFEKCGFQTNLAMMVVLDSYLHSGSVPDFLRSRFPASVPAKGGDEKEWISQYVETRHNWLANHSRKNLRGTIYRTRFLKEQIDKKAWDLTPPFIINGAKLPY